MAESDTNNLPEQAKKLVRVDYTERIHNVEARGRRITDQFIRNAIGDFTPDSVSIADLRRMHKDNIIKMGLHFSKAPILSAEYTVKSEDPILAAAVQEMVDNVHQSITKIGLGMFGYGSAAAIKSYKVGKLSAMVDSANGRVKAWDDEDISPVIIGRPYPIAPEFADPDITEDNRFDGILTPILTSDSGGKVPREHSLWFVNEFEEENANWYGVARIESAYRFWWSYWHTYYLRDRHAEQDADPALQIWYPPGFSRDADGKKINNRDVALEIGAGLRGGSTIAWPSDVHISDNGQISTTPLWKADFLQGGQNLAAFNDLLSDIETSKLRACMVPEQALIEAKGGTSSRNAAASYEQIFTQSLEQTAKNMDEIWNKHIIRPVVEANWGPDAPEVKLTTTGFQDHDLSLATELVKVAFSLDPNALPIKFETIMEQLGLPQYSADEQREREQDAAKQAEDAAPPEQIPGQDPNVQPDPNALAASQHRTKSRKYETERIEIHPGSLNLHQGHKEVDSTAPRWAKSEGARRKNNTDSVSERLRVPVQAAYTQMFILASESVAEQAGSLDLSVASKVAGLVKKINQKIREAIGVDTGMGTPQTAVSDELAGLYHASGAAELQRLGYDASSWDVGQDEIQGWARFRGGELITTMEKTVVERHVRPWLATNLQKLGQEDARGIPYGAEQLALDMSVHFEGYPQWMAERVVRSEARMGYNNAAAEIWRSKGVQEVTMFDGLGGKSGKTDAVCLRRNGQRVTIDEFLEEDKREHPNGTLGAVPVLTNIDPAATQDIRRYVSDVYPADRGIYVSQSIYAVEDGLILSQEQTGSRLAEDD